MSIVSDGRPPFGLSCCVMMASVTYLWPATRSLCQSHSIFVSTVSADRPDSTKLAPVRQLIQLDNDLIATPLLLLCLLLYLSRSAVPPPHLLLLVARFRQQESQGAAAFDVHSPSGNLSQFGSDGRDLRRIIEQGDACERSRHLPTARAIIGVEEPVGSVQVMLLLA